MATIQTNVTDPTGAGTWYKFAKVGWCMNPTEFAPEGIVAVKVEGRVFIPVDAFTKLAESFEEYSD